TVIADQGQAGFVLCRKSAQTTYRWPASSTEFETVNDSDIRYPFGGRHWIPTGQPAALGPTGSPPMRSETITGSVHASGIVQSSSAGHFTIRICHPPPKASLLANVTKIVPSGPTTRSDAWSESPPRRPP